VPVNLNWTYIDN